MTSTNRFGRWLVVIPLTVFAVLVWDVTSRLRDAEQTAQELFVRGFEVDASRREGMRDLLARDVQSGNLSTENINEETLPRYLDTHVLPDPGLVIRTSGEARISNFLLWQSAYSEYEFIDTLWPDFTAEIFSSIISEFENRERRFGGIIR